MKYYIYMKSEVIKQLYASRVMNNNNNNNNKKKSAYGA